AAEEEAGASGRSHRRADRADRAVGAARGQVRSALLLRRQRQPHLQERVPMTLGRRRRRASSALTASLAAAMLLSASAFADVTKEQCIDANGQAQELRREGKLAAAREQLRLCGNPKCPAMVRDDCAKRLDEVDKAQPTVAFTVKDATGADVTAVKVMVDVPAARVQARRDGARRRRRRAR